MHGGPERCRPEQAMALTLNRSATTGYVLAVDLNWHSESHDGHAC